MEYNGKTGIANIRIFAVKVKTEDVDFDALINPATGERFNLASNHFLMEDKVHVDNLSFNACNYTLDNVMVLNAHSRGFLVKSRDVTIKHCTFRNVSYNAILVRSETEYAESSISKNVLIRQCLFDHTGYIFEGIVDKNQAVIRIQGASTTVSEDTLPIDNITITGCKFTNNDQRVAIWVNSAKNVKITNNTFDPIVGDDLPLIPGTAILLDTCMGVEISDNTYNLKQYAENGNDVKTVIQGNNYKNIFGTDVVDENGASLLPDKISGQ